MGLTLAFVRHGQPRRVDSDPGLTSAGRRMAYETGEWLALGGLRPRLVRHTPTARTRETAEELCLSFPEAALGQGPVSPEGERDWQRLADALREELGGTGSAVLVGHHPTVAFLLQAFGPAPEPVPLRNLAVGLVLEETPSSGWEISRAWPGRPAL